MSTTTDDTKPNQGVNPLMKYGLIWPLCVVVPIFVSIMMGGEFLQSLGTGHSAGVLRGMSTAIIGGAPLLAVMSGLAYKLGYKKSAGATMLVIFTCIFFSTSTTTMSLLKAADNKIKEQVNESDDVVESRDQLKINKDSIASLRQQINGRDPVRWAGMRSGWEDDIAKLNAENKELRSTIKGAHESKESSSVHGSFAWMAQFGITKGMLALVAAALMDAIPAVTLFLLGLLAGHAFVSFRGKGSESGTGDTGKKTGGFWSRLRS